jgi:hypothetical protein
MVNNSQNENKSTILDLESLIKQYDTLLIQYNHVQSDYINYLQNNSSSIQQGRDTSNLAIIANNTFWGSDGISNTNVSSVEQCSALCSKTPGCSGATYNITNNSQNNCWLRKGDGMVVSGNSNQYAIIPKSKEYLLTLQTLNSQLSNANHKIIEVFQKYSSLTDQDKERMKKYNLLKQNYSNLEGERLKILKQLEDYQTIEEKHYDGNLIVTKNYYNYILLLLIALICFVILSKTVVDSVIQYPQNNGVSRYYFILFCLLLVLVISYFYRRFK